MKKKLVVAGIIILALVAGGYGVYRFGVGFLFDRYLMKTALSSVANIDETVPEGDPGNASETGAIPPLNSEEPKETTENIFEQQQKQNEEKPKKRLSNTEIITRVMRSSELTNKMSAMVSHEDKRNVIKIILSNFTATEIADIAKNVAGGMPPGYKSKMIAEARSRLTPAQWQECLGVAYKYIEEIRPYVE